MLVVVAEFGIAAPFCRPQFHERLLPHTSVLMNCMYWDATCPRLITNDQMSAEWVDRENNRLLVVGDITCDVGGSVEFLSKSTTIEDPFFKWDPSTQEMVRSDGSGVLVLGVDILPSELPRESSMHFSNLLTPMVEALASGEPDPEMVAVLDGACIARNGALQPRFEYIKTLADHVRAETVADENSKQIMIRGHLFDTGLINKALDLLEALGVEFSVDRIDVQPNLGFGRQIPSRVLITLPGERVTEVCAAMELQLNSFPQAKASVTIK
jgi:alpha-aminoadipic semialdehyde synthase